MPNDKSITIRARIDSSEIDKDIKALQQKLEQINRQSRISQQSMAQFGQKTQMGQFAKSFFGDFNKESINNLKQAFDLNVKKLQTEERLLKNKIKEVEKLKKLEDQLAESEKMRLKRLEQEINKIKEKGRTLTEINQKIAQQGMSLGASPEVFDMVGGQAGRPYNLAAMSNYRQLRQMGLGRGVARVLSPLGIGPQAVVSGLIGGAGFAARAGYSIWQERALAEGNIRMAQGAAARTITPYVGAAETPENLENFAVRMPYTARGMGIASRELQSRRARDILGGASTGFFGGAAAGAALGFGFGGIGAIPGAIMGGIFGLTGNMLLNKNNRIALLGTQEYREKITAEALQRGRALEEAMFAADIPRSLAFRGYQKLLPTITGYEQAFGMGSLAEPTNLLGMTNQMGMTGRTGLQIGKALQGASGITFGLGQLGQARQSFLMRQAGISNAATLFGRAMGLEQGMGTQQTDEAVKKLFGEAVRIGVDSSKMVEEIKQFTNAASALAMERGISVNEAGRLIGAGMTGEFSTRNLRAAMSAAQIRQRESGFGNAENLTYKLGFMNTEQGRKMLQGLGFTEQLAFAGLSEGEISLQNPEVRRMMKMMGIEQNEAGIGEFRKRKAQMELFSRLKTTGLIEEYQGMMGEFEKLSPEEQRKAFAKGGALEGQMGKIMSQLRIQRGDQFAGDFRKLMSYIVGISPERLGGAAEGGEGLMGALLERGKGTVGARREQAMATAEGRRVRRVGGFIDEFLDNMQKAASASTELQGIIEDFQKAAGSSTAAMEAFANVINAFNESQRTGNQGILNEAIAGARKTLLEEAEEGNIQPVKTPNTRGTK